VPILRAMMGPLESNTNSGQVCVCVCVCEGGDGLGVRNFINIRFCYTICRKPAEVIQNVYRYISLDTDKDCDLVQGRPILSTGKMPHDKQNRNCPFYSQTLIMNPGGASKPRRTDGRTDCLSD
jgi:hypothetical protein